MLGRISGKLRRKHDDEKVEGRPEEGPSAVVKPAATTETGVAADGLASGDTADSTAQVGPKVEEPVAEREMVDSTPAVHVNQGSVAAATAGLAPATRHPGLERHISHIGDSDDDVDDDETGYEDHHASGRHEDLGEDRAHIVANRVLTSPVDASFPANEETDEPSLDNRHLARDPVFDAAATGDVAAYRSSSGPAPHTSDIRDNDTQEEEVGPERATTEADEAPHTFGPHKSDLANIVDPRVKPDPEELKKRTEEKRAETDGSKKDWTPVPVATSKKAQEDQRAKDVHFGKEGKDQKGVLGFFSRLRNRDSRPDNKLEKSDKTPEATKSIGAGVPESAGTAANTITPAGKGVEQHAGQVGTDGPIGDEQPVSGMAGNPGASSPSSFKRHDGGLKDTDDLSSSGLEEDDLDRGRGGRLAGKLGLGKNGGAGGMGVDKPERQRSGVSNEEQFEEARDHFDESLAPPPAFGGQAKSSSPVRETRFKEEV